MDAELYRFSFDMKYFSNVLIYLGACVGEFENIWKGWKFFEWNFPYNFVRGSYRFFVRNSKGHLGITELIYKLAETHWHF